MDTNINKMMSKYFGYTSFKPGQARILKALLHNHDVLAIMPTGGGKSLCYQLTALLLPGLTLVISPLISLMKDQVDALNNQGIPASYINSSLSIAEINKRLYLAKQNKLKLLYIAPERLESPDFVQLLSGLSLSLVAVDEAHCVSRWGHDFRPNYMSIGPWIKSIPNRPRVAAFTATATATVRHDIITYLGLNNPAIQINSFNRENLYFAVSKGQDKLAFIQDYIRKHPEEPGIIYASTRKEVDNLYEYLSKKGFSAGKYHAGLSIIERTNAQEDFLYDRIQVMIATNAFGMGIDKSNVRFVIHYNMPGNLEAYYQEAGRAGRDGQQAECILLYHAADIQVQKYLIEMGNLSAYKKEMEYGKLQNMIDFCHTPRCLRKTMLTYFGEEEGPDNCAYCANCEERENRDITIEGQKIFSCILRMNQQYGSNLIAAVLKGSKQKRILELGLDRLSTYGIMDNLATAEIVEYINILTAEEYLTITGGGYPILKLTNKARPVLKGQEKIIISLPKTTEPPVTDNDLFKKLRLLRLNIAQKENLPPYVVFSDKTLKDMAAKLPVDRESMLQVSGVGEVKFEKYGQAFLEVIKRFKGENETLPEYADKEADTEAKIITISDRPKVKKSQKTPTHIISWQFYQAGQNINKIAQERELTKITIENHLIKAAQEGYEINWREFISPEDEAAILDVVKKTGVSKLRPIKDLLPDHISYLAIQLAIVKNNPD